MNNLRSIALNRGLFATARLLALLGSLLTGQPATAEDHWSGVAERLNGVHGWDDLCEIEDCDQFPAGYATYAVGPDLYHLPHFDTLTEKPPAVYSVHPGRFYERGENGDLIRSFGYKETLTLNYCCYYLLTFFGLAENFPVFSPLHRSSSVRVKLSQWDVGRSLRRTIGIDEPYGALPPAYDEIFPDELQSFNEDFWLVRFNPPDPAKAWARYSLFSKRPLFNGRFVFGGCGLTCSFRSVAFLEDAQDKRPRISFSGLWVQGVQDFTCDRTVSGLNCSAPPEALNHIDTLFERLELLFKTAQIYPQ